MMWGGPGPVPTVGRGAGKRSRDTTSASVSRSFRLSAALARPPALSPSLMWHASEIIHLRGRVGGNAGQHGRAACADCGDGTGALVGVALAISDRAAAQKAANSLSS